MPFLRKKGGFYELPAALKDRGRKHVENYNMYSKVVVTVNSPVQPNKTQVTYEQMHDLTANARTKGELLKASPFTCWIFHIPRLPIR